MANLQRIRTGSTGALTALERESLHELVKEYNSDFRTKAATVDDVSKITPEEGAIVVSNHDGRQYYADRFGWHQAGAEYSLVTLFIDFDGTTQFSFKFKLPAENTITLNWGDGTSTEVEGDGDTEVTEVSEYAAAGVYYFTVTGEVTELTYLWLVGQPLSYDISGWSRLPNLTEFSIYNSGAYGSIDSWGVLTNLYDINFSLNEIGGSIKGLYGSVGLVELLIFDTNIYGDIGDFDVFQDLIKLQIVRANITGDASKLSALSLSRIDMSETPVTFDNIVPFTIAPSSITAWCVCHNNNWTSKMVDNILISLANGSTHDIAYGRFGGTNAPRTSASDAAYDALIAAGCDIAVNE